MIWVHDYHLMLLPQMLRKAKPDAYISFFLHIPFPSSEIYRILPVREQLLEGLLASNVVGFHTFDFARHFLSSVSRSLGLDTTPRGCLHNGIFSHTHVFPIGIDPDQFKV
jgi:trehalose 6-phosphate synthase